MTGFPSKKSAVDVLSDISTALAFVESPFQMTNLLDLAQYKSSIRFNVIARLNGDKKNDDAVLRMVKSRNLKNVNVRLVRVSSRGKKKLFDLLRLVPCISSVLSASYVIFYDDRSLIYKAFNRMVRGKIILADDGAYSFIKIAKLEKEGDNRVAGFITRFDGLKSNCIEIIHVPFKSIELKTDGYSLVIGMPLFEKGIISEKAHLELVRSMIKKIKMRTGDNVYYFPHRSENAYKKLGVPVIETSLSVEEYVESVSSNAPSHVVSMYSTALFVLSSKFSGLECFYYRLPYELINNPSAVRNIGLVYDAFRNSPCKELK